MYVQIPALQVIILGKVFDLCSLISPYEKRDGGNS